MDSVVTLKIVTRSDYQFLYDLLEERDAIANISHHTMPTYKEHVKFIMSKPYSKWYVILYNDQRVGSIYLTKQNEIGISIKKNVQHIRIKYKALQLLMNYNPRKKYFVNVSPKNKTSISFFKKNGFKLIQYTYALVSTDRIQYIKK